MNINVFLYFTDGEWDYCFSCAVKEAVDGWDIDIEARDHSFEGTDMRSDIECCKCHKRAEYHVIA